MLPLIIITARAPATGAEALPDAPVTLEWEVEEDLASTYDVFLGAGDIPKTPTVSGLTSTRWTTPFDLQPSTTYRWKVTARSGWRRGESPASSFWTPQTWSADDSSIVLLNVRDGDSLWRGWTVTSSGTVYSCTVPGAVTHVHLGLLVPTGASATIDGSANLGIGVALGDIGTTTRVSIVVRSRDRSTTSSYTLELSRSPFPPPPAPAPIAPLDGAVGCPLSTTLSWTASEDPNDGGTMYYEVRVRIEKSPPGDIVFTLSGKDNTTFYFPAYFLEPSVKYTWTVIALDSNGDSSAQGWESSFTTAAWIYY